MLSGRKKQLIPFILGYLLPISLFAQSNSIRIEGQILAESGAPLSGANVFVVGSRDGAATDRRGYFKFSTLVADSLIVTVTHIGFTNETRILLVKPTDDQVTLKFFLKEKIVSFSPVVITGDPRNTDIITALPTVRYFTRNDILQTPSLGNGDIFRVVQNLPGVQSTSEYSNQLHIQGGTPDQNLVLFNGAPVYQPFHLFGLSSSLDAGSVETVKYQGGNFSSQHGDRLSGVLEIITRPGTSKFHSELSFNPLHSRFSLSGPIGNGIRWRTTFRRTYFDYLTRVADQSFPYHYFDGEIKISYQRNPKSLVTLNILQTVDEFLDEEKSGYYNPRYEYHPDPIIAFADSNYYFRHNRTSIRWNNQVASLRWVKRVSDKLMGISTIYTSSVNQWLDNIAEFTAHDSASVSTLGFVEDQNHIYGYSKGIGGTQGKTRFTDRGFTSDWNYNFSTSLEFQGGFFTSIKNYNYQWRSPDFDFALPYVTVFTDWPEDTMDTEDQLSQGGIHGQLIFTGERFFVSAGGRLTQYSMFPGFHFSPRLFGNIDLLPSISIHLAGGRYYQSSGTATETGFYSIAAVLWPVIGSIPSEADNLSVGISIKSRNDMVRAGINYYRRWLRRLVFVEEQGQFNKASAASWGLETSLYLAEKKRWSVSTSYTVSKVIKHYDGVFFYPNYDQRHKLTSIASFKLSKTIKLGFVWNVATGRPANLAHPEFYGAYPNGGLWPFLLPAQFNLFRYPAFHRLDASVVWSKTIRNWRWGLTLEVLNLYGRKNVVFYRNIVEKLDDKTKERTYSAVEFNGFPFMPLLEVWLEL